MHWIASILVALVCVLPLHAQRKSLLQNEPGAIYLSEVLDKPLMLKVVKQAPVYLDVNGERRVGFLQPDQMVELEAITDKVYRVRGKGTRDGIAGWVGPWAFESTDPKFVANLKIFYTRQIAVNKLIEAKEVALGMTPAEVQLARGAPTKTTMRRTDEGESGSFEYIDYEDVKHYVTWNDRFTGQVFRQFSHITREEKGKTVIEFEGGLASAIEESEQRRAPNVRIVIPPVIFRY